MAMTKNELRAALLRNGFTVAEFAGWVGVTAETVYRWGGASGVPRWATRLLALIDQHGRAHVLGDAVAQDSRGGEG